MFHQQQQRRDSSLSHMSGSRSWAESDSEDDIITPCTPEKAECCVSATEMQQPPSKPAPQESRRTSLVYRHRSEDNDVDIQGLWECMLELQQRYHCYNSTRMEIAADQNGSMEMMPSRACIDLLNDSIKNLPSEGWKMLNKHLDRDGETYRRSQKWKFWKQH